MKLLVCVKQVPEIDLVRISSRSGGGLRLDPFGEERMNRFDAYAVEAALQIRERGAAGAAVGIEALTVGPESAQEVVRRAMGMGADEGIHLLTPAGEDPCAAISPAGVAEGIRQHAADNAYDLILCGSMSEDGMHSQVGPRLAGGLGWPCAIQVAALRVAEMGAAIVVEKEVEGGHRERLRLALPAVVAVQPGIHTPRYPALSKLLRANARQLTTRRLNDLDGMPGRTPLRGLVAPPAQRAGRVLEGSAGEKAAALLALLRERGWLDCR